MHPEIWQNQPKNVILDKTSIISQLLSISKKQNKWRLANTRAVVSSPLIWIPKVWSPYRNKIKWHPRLVFADTSVNFDCSVGNFEPGKLWDLSSPVVMFDLLKYVPTRRNEWNFYGLSTIKRRRTFETKTAKRSALGWALQWCFSLIKHTVRPRDGYLCAEKEWRFLVALTIDQKQFTPP